MNPILTIILIIFGLLLMSGILYMIFQDYLSTKTPLQFFLLGIELTILGIAFNARESLFGLVIFISGIMLSIFGFIKTEKNKCT